MLKKRRRKIKRENKQTNKKKCHKNYKENTGTKLISNTKKHKLKIQSTAWNFKNTMLKKRRKNKKTRSKNYYIYIYMYMKFAEEEKNRVFFFLQSNRL